MSGKGNVHFVGCCTTASVSGCEAIAEVFYSLVTTHKKSGGQSNDILIQREIVNWSIPDPIN